MGGPLWSSSDLVSASTSITSARSTSTSTQTPASTTPTTPHWRAPSIDCAVKGSATPVSPSPSPTLKSGPQSALVIPDRFSRLPVLPATRIDGHRHRRAMESELPCFGRGLPARAGRASRPIWLAHVIWARPKPSAEWPMCTVPSHNFHLDYFE
jgi:hypothetical protein